jgi:hypothetical protein
MTATREARSFTVRLPGELHNAASEAAARNGSSLNKLLQRLVEEYLRKEAEQQLFDSFTRLGEDLAECDVEYAWEAQREAIERAEL